MSDNEKSSPSQSSLPQSLPLSLSHSSQPSPSSHSSSPLDSLCPGSIKRLVLSGGGAKGYAMLGALQYIDETKGLTDIDEYWGTSVGSILCTLLIVGYTPFEAFHKLFVLDSPIAEGDLESALEINALCSISVVGNRVRHLLCEKLDKRAAMTTSTQPVSLLSSSNPTFAELYERFGKKLHIIGTNTTTMQGECFNVDTHPTMNIIDAIEISCDIHYLFSKKEYNGHVYVDGGLVNNYPINLADDGHTNVLGICAGGNADIPKILPAQIAWFFRLMQIPLMELHRERVQRISSKVINIELALNINIINFSPTTSQNYNYSQRAINKQKSPLINF